MIPMYSTVVLYDLELKVWKLRNLWDEGNEGRGGVATFAGDFTHPKLRNYGKYLI